MVGTQNDTVNRDPIEIQILNGLGYVWNADDALWLRESCGLVGAMIGGIAAFKQQNAIHGLPLQLGAEEVTLALDNSWAKIVPHHHGIYTPESNEKQKEMDARTKEHNNNKKRSWGDHDDDEDDYNYDNEEYLQEETDVPEWKTALAQGSYFSIPMTPDDVVPRENTINTNNTIHTAACIPIASPSRENEEKPSTAPNQTHSPTLWNFPSTKRERHRYLIFKDLHSKGFRITGGSKFGSDFLLYPGDPSLYHAQFCVRIYDMHGEIVPALLAAACRGSFQARKHLLMASVCDNDSTDNDGGKMSCYKTNSGTIAAHERVVYTTFGPVDGFG